MQRKNVHLTERQIDRLRQLSKDTGLPVAELVRRAIDGYLEYQDTKKEPPADD